MPHDGQDMTAPAPILADLLALTRDAVPAADALLDRAKTAVRAKVTDGDRVSGSLIEDHQTAAHGLAWIATYTEALRQMQG